MSDILGTDEDVISKRLEDEVEIKLLKKAIAKLSQRERNHYQAPFRAWKAGK